MSFNPLWINTALKQTFRFGQLAEVSIPYGLTLLSNSYPNITGRSYCFNPLWINTALKLYDDFFVYCVCFNPLWINTALKPIVHGIIGICGFNPLWINTALKPSGVRFTTVQVSIPYGLTLLSNGLTLHRDVLMFQSPMD